MTEWWSSLSYLCHYIATTESEFVNVPSVVTDSVDSYVSFSYGFNPLRRSLVTGLNMSTGSSVWTSKAQPSL